MHTARQEPARAKHERTPTGVRGRRGRPRTAPSQVGNVAGGTGRLLRAALIYLAANFTAIGLWATVASRNFYDNFPGGGHRWLAGDGPYSAPLVSDAGVGFLAVGAVLVRPRCGGTGALCRPPFWR